MYRCTVNYNTPGNNKDRDMQWEVNNTAQQRGASHLGQVSWGRLPGGVTTELIYKLFRLKRVERCW